MTNYARWAALTEQLVTIDIEITNRCNANCWFCPRDQTPHVGLMSPEVFDQALRQAIAYRLLLGEHLSADALAGVNVSLCGLGEPLLNREAERFVRKVRDAGVVCSMSSNGSLLDEERAHALVDAGLSEMYFNVGDVDADYEAVYSLPFERTCENVVRFSEIAGDDCDVWIVLVDHHRDAEHSARMRDFWRERGIKRFLPYAVINRGGALQLHDMQYEEMPETVRARSVLQANGVTLRCGVPFEHPFIGYDGQYYLCSSDWKKQTPMGSVFDHTFLEVMQAKLDLVDSREPVCKSCGHDPTNQLADAVRDLATGDSTSAETAARFAAASEKARLVDQHVSTLLADSPAQLPVPRRTFIPVAPI
jgi:MoaA/NifB/PqqE/SkfB family radical SAM enzyme